MSFVMSRRYRLANGRDRPPRIADRDFAPPKSGSPVIAPAVADALPAAAQKADRRRTEDTILRFATTRSGDLDHGAGRPESPAGRAFRVRSLCLANARADEKQVFV